MRSMNGWFVIISGLTAVRFCDASAVPIYGSPGYDETTQTGYVFSDPYEQPVKTLGSGAAAGQVVRPMPDDFQSAVVVRWDASGNAVELGNLGVRDSNTSFSTLLGGNASGTVIGYSDKIVDNASLGYRAVRWDAGSTTPTELGNLGTNASGGTTTTPYAINAAGLIVGAATKYVNGNYIDTRAVRWNAGQTAANELGLVTIPGKTINNSYARAINAGGMSVGFASAASNVYQGQFAVRWDGVTGAPTVLGSIGTASDGVSESAATDINATGTAVGYGLKYRGGSRFDNAGDHAIRWAAGSATPTELGGLGDDGTGYFNATAFHINDAGTAIGLATKYVNNVNQGYRAVRWDAGGTAATELGYLHVAPNGAGNAFAESINAAGLIVGYVEDYAGSTSLGRRGVLWGADGKAIDLNTLIDPASSWTLTDAYSISDTNWVSGSGTFDPDGNGPLSPYGRLFLMQVPEPSTLAIVAGIVLLPLRRLRR